MPAKMKPSVYHAVIIIFLEFFAWGLLTTPMMDVSYVFIVYILKLNLNCLNVVVILKYKK